MMIDWGADADAEVDRWPSTKRPGSSERDLDHLHGIRCSIRAALAAGEEDGPGSPRSGR
jgi:hypothetical protein